MYKRYIYIVLFSMLLALFGCRSGKDVIQESGINSGQNKFPDNSSLFIDAEKEKILGNDAAAMKLFEKCLVINPADDASMFELAQLFTDQKDGEQALKYAEMAAKTNPDNVYYQLFYGQILQASAKYDQAVKAFEQIVKLKPNNPEYYDRLALAYLYADKPMSAIAVYDKLEEKAGISEDYALKKQNIYMQEKKVSKAIEEIEKLIAAFPDEAKYYALLAELYMSNNMEEKGIEAYNKIAEIDPENPYIFISLADYYKKKGEPKKAFEYLKKGFANPALDIDSKIQVLIQYYTVDEIYTDMKQEALILSQILKETHPDDPKAYSIRGDFLYQNKDYDGARDAFREVIRLDSSKYLVWEQLLFTESELNDTDALLSESLTTIELFPEQPLPYLFVGSVYYQQKKWDECIAILNKGLYYVTNNGRMESQFYTYLGDTYNQVKDNEKSDESYDKVLEIDPDNDYVLNNYAYFLSLRGEKLEKAAKLAKRATELKPGNSNNMDTYAWVLYKLKYYDEAKTWIQKAIDSSTEDNAVILEHMGDILWKLNSQDEAVVYWEKALKAGTGSDFLPDKVKDKKLYE